VAAGSARLGAERAARAVASAAAELQAANARDSIERDRADLAASAAKVRGGGGV
jgi:hypothetical protein